MSVTMCCAVLVIAFNAAPNAERESRDLIPRRTAQGEIEGWKSFHADPGVKTSDVWKLTDEGILVCRGTPLGYLYTERQYADARLELEWRWPPDGQPGKGGLLLRMAGEHKIWPKSLEVQLNHGQAGDFWGLGGYTLAGPPDRMESVDHPQFGKLTHVKRAKACEKPAGQWNHCAVTLRGDQISVTINGELVNTAHHCEPLAGPLLLTAEGAEIQFRHIRMKEGR